MASTVSGHSCVHRPHNDTRKAAAHFDAWTGGRKIASFGTNDGATPLPFQNWHRFKEAYAPELVARAVESSECEVTSCFDPFGGSGTTALTAQMLGASCTTIEVNPFLADLIRAKLHFYDIDKLVTSLAVVRKEARRRHRSKPSFDNLPRSFVEPGINDRWLFNADIAARVFQLLRSIESIEDPGIVRLFRVLVGGMLAEVSNVTVSGKGRRYRKNWSNLKYDPTIVDITFAARAEAAIRDIQAFKCRPNVDAQVIEGDAREANLPNQFDLSVFSPPYPNSFDYTDVYNLQLWMLGYLTQPSDNRSLRNATLSSHVQLHREYAAPPAGSNTLDIIVEKLNASRSTLWSPWLPAMVGAYFADLKAVIDAVISRLTADGRCWIVVGDSSYAGIAIPVATVLNELADKAGWVVHGSESIRVMKSSAQQGWKPQLAESLIILGR